ncbi:UvrD-helicase domain-containing protein [Fuchsiella alkaliacetigena]|uniref:UvrD-helicase domain-containing protein n=1 Tax=Fuchsiella alkaliacetigena TaxID=957042 RepID=UPI00200B2855|nr:UvrD-helicase domain-containing protein [Fuchsiella alkaliacetigena]MCK8825660.1 hypothetical protein [Fuchsiella alkaliacetigena]
MQRIYVGPTGSGKTTILQEKYREKVKQSKTEDCLVFAKDAGDVSNWRLEIDLKQMGPLQIFSYFGFIQQELKQYWHLVDEELPGGRKSLEPTFMTVEPAHYLMSELVREAREEGAFASVKATSEQIAVQLIDNLNLAAMNSLNKEQLEDKLLGWAGADLDKAAAYEQGLELMLKFKELAREERCLDYSTLIKLYHQHLLNDSQYCQELLGRYHYLIVDDLEKMVPGAQQLILKLMEGVEESYFSFNPEGGFGRFFGSAPEMARENFFPRCELVELEGSYTSSERARSLVQNLMAQILEDQPLAESPYIKDRILTDLRGEMLVQVGEQIVELIEQGIEPGQIAVIAPSVDQVLDFALTKYLEDRGYNLLNLSSDRRLLDNSFAEALIVLSLLANPEWKLELNFSSLLHTLSLVLELDPVRSALLSEEIFKNKLELPDLDKVGLRARLGFANSDSYEQLKEWLLEQQNCDFELDYFLGRIFAELLAPLTPAEKDILACRQLIDSIAKFKEVGRAYWPQEELNRRFMKMLQKGTLAAKVLFKSADVQDQVLLSTPYSFLSFSHLDSVKYQFWLDISNQLWLQGSSKELSNPYLLSQRELEESWSDSIDRSLRKQQLCDYLRSLLGKSTQGLYLADSYLSSRGWEQDGVLADWLSADYLGVSADD